LLAVEREGFADGVGRGAEFAFSEACADERDRSGASLVVGRDETAACRGLHAKDGKEIGRDELRLRLLGGAEAGEAERVAARDGHGGERVILFLPIEEIGVGDRAGVEVRLALVQGDELVTSPPAEDRRLLKTRMS
jgi:hypothetical protein